MNFMEDIRLEISDCQQILIHLKMLIELLLCITLCNPRSNTNTREALSLQRTYRLPE